jgi:hypothetical protein
MTRWSLVVSDDTDQRLRTFLGAQGAKKGSLSRFVEEAVSQRLRFEETVDQVQERNSIYPEAEISRDIEAAINAVRAEKHAPDA